MERTQQLYYYCSLPYTFFSFAVLSSMAVLHSVSCSVTGELVISLPCPSQSTSGQKKKQFNNIVIMLQKKKFTAWFAFW